MSRSSRHLAFVALMLAPLPVLAGIDRVYHPYVTPLETELEWRSTVADDSDPAKDDVQMHRLAFGQTFGEKLFAEAYLIGRKTDAQDLKISGFELEALYQLTEPGEHFADLAALVEFERDTDRNISYIGGGLVAEKELGETSLALNLIGEYEYGGGIEDEFDTEVAAQWRWRWRERFEPAVEYYVDEYTEGVGPVLTGLERLGQQQKLKWEFGLIFGTGNDAPDQTWRALLEYEF